MTPPTTTTTITTAAMELEMPAEVTMEVEPVELAVTATEDSEMEAAHGNQQRDRPRRIRRAKRRLGGHGQQAMTKRFLVQPPATERRGRHKMKRLNLEDFKGTSDDAKKYGRRENLFRIQQRLAARVQQPASLTVIGFGKRVPAESYVEVFINGINNENTAAQRRYRDDREYDIEDDNQPAMKKQPMAEGVDRLDWKKLGLGFGGSNDSPPNFDTEGKAHGSPSTATTIAVATAAAAAMAAATAATTMVVATVAATTVVSEEEASLADAGLDEGEADAEVQADWTTTALPTPARSLSAMQSRNVAAVARRATGGVSARNVSPTKKARQGSSRQPRQAPPILQQEVLQQRRRRQEMGSGSRGGGSTVRDGRMPRRGNPEQNAGEGEEWERASSKPGEERPARREQDGGVAGASKPQTIDTNKENEKANSGPTMCMPIGTSIAAGHLSAMSGKNMTAPTDQMTSLPAGMTRRAAVMSGGRTTAANRRQRKAEAEVRERREERAKVLRMACMTRNAPVDIVEGFGGGTNKVLRVWRFAGTTQYQQRIVVDALLVDGQGDELLIGEDWMVEHQVKIDFGARELKFRDANGQKFILPFTCHGMSTLQQLGQERKTVVRLARTTKLAANTRSTLYLQVNAEDGSTGIFVPKPSSKRHLLIAPTVDTVKDGMVRVVVMNVEGRREKQPAREALGIWIPTDDDMQILSMNGELERAQVAKWVAELKKDDTRPLADENELDIGEMEDHDRD
uniref:Uncharacterized protein n=1 Tax=Phytophthora ramorum TaxID=164328 RepID=H3GPF4_PHYRM